MLNSFDMFLITKKRKLITSYVIEKDMIYIYSILQL